MSYQIFNEDCIEGMKKISDGSVDLVLTDLPFGITTAPFDKRIPFAPMWQQFWRVTKRNAAVVLFANGKFLIELASSNLRDYRYKWVWRKNFGVGFLNSKKMPLKIHEDILVFYRALPTYNPQFSQGKPYKVHSGNNSVNYSKQKSVVTISDDGKRYPRDVQKFNQFICSKEKTFHPTQKPIDLLEYLIRTYTDEGETVLDATMGSGSTGVAAINTGRNFVGFELEQKFFDIARKRIDEAVALKAQSLF